MVSSGREFISVVIMLALDKRSVLLKSKIVISVYEELAACSKGARLLSFQNTCVKWVGQLIY